MAAKCQSKRQGSPGSALALLAAVEPQFTPETCLPILTSRDLTAGRRTGLGCAVPHTQPGRAPSPGLPASTAQGWRPAGGRWLAL
jgi:hypothetical protein